MASAVAETAVTPAFLAANPFLGFTVLTMAALFDSQILYPGLAGKGKQAAKPSKFLDVPVGSNEPGAPRIWACGRRVRVPTHVLWQAKKTRESGAGSSKQGTTINQKRVFIDAVLALNDRKTIGLTQLIGNGGLLLMKTLNLKFIESTSMIVSVSGGRLILTMSSSYDRDFSSMFAVNNVVELRRFIGTAGADPNIGYWKIAVVTGHAAIPSRIELDPYSGQVVAGIVATAGTAFSPASVTRIDDKVFSEGGAFLPDPSPSTTVGFIVIPTNAGGSPLNTFDLGAVVQVSGLTLPGYGSLDNVQWDISGTQANQISLMARNGVVFTNLTGAPIAISGGSSTNAVYVRYAVQPRFAAAFFPSTFNPDALFQDGDVNQDQSTLIVAAMGSNVPAYRGVACQGVDDFFVTQFGDDLPFSLEALIDPDLALTWGQALELVLQRGAVPSSAIDTSGVGPRPFLGFFTRGPVAPATVIQPLLLAGSILTQERDGTICLFDYANADVVQIRNSPTLSDLGCHVYGDQRQDDKFRIEDIDDPPAPTSVGIRHQDPDKEYADGYEHFGLRNPGNDDIRNEVELDMSTLVLSRKDARDIASTHLRRERINRRRRHIAIPPNYMDLLENDVLTTTDDNGNIVTVRIIQRDFDASCRVLGVCVDEDLNLAVSGSPVQTTAGSIPPLPTVPAFLRSEFVDVPALANDEIVIPAIKIAVCPFNGSIFAGAQIWESMNGSNWNHVGNVGVPAAIGTTTGADLSNVTASEVYGSSAVTFHSQSINVVFDCLGPTGAIEGATDDEALGGKNWIAFLSADGSVEIAAFTTVAFVSGTTWTLGRLLRGLRGTTPAVRTPGTVVVLLGPRGLNGIFTREFAGQITPPSLAYKIVPAGLGLDDVPARPVVAQWRNVLPLPVRKVTKTIGGSPFNARFTITAHWCRQLLRLGTQPPHPMDEQSESYLVEIYHASGIGVRRSHTIVASPPLGTGSPVVRDKWYDYSSTFQSADGYTPGAATTFWIDVRQIGQFGLGPSIKQLI